MSKLIISLTTIRSRINKVDSVINSLLSQATSVDYKVYLFISKEPYLLDEGISELPPSLIELERKYPEKFSVQFTENIGPYRKFIPILTEYFHDRLDLEYFVTVDDDTVYPSHWLEELILASQKHDCVVAYRGRMLRCDKSKIYSYKQWLHSSDETLIPDIKTVGTGKDGIIYKPEFFHPDVIDIKSALLHCNHADDLWLKLHTAINGVPTALLNASLCDAFSDIGADDDNTLYRKINKHGGNDRAMQNLKRYFMSRYQLNLLDVFNLNLSRSSTWLAEPFLNSYF